MNIEGQKREGLSRPENFDSFIGQEHIISHLQIMIGSALKRGAALDHLLFFGPPGLGKTTLANIVSCQMGSEVHMISAPNISKKGDLAAILARLLQNDVLFIDEIHRLPISLEEILYSAMEDYRIELMVGKGPGAKILPIELPPFTLIGATTRPGGLSRPLLDRFGGQLEFQYYNDVAMKRLVERNSEKLGLSLSKKAIELLASVGRGTPRIANNYLKRLLDWCLVKDLVFISEKSVEQFLSVLDIGPFGLTGMEQKVLLMMKELFKGGPVGVDNLCSVLDLDKSSFEVNSEPFLVRNGLIERTPRGRVLTEEGERAIFKWPNKNN